MIHTIPYFDAHCDTIHRCHTAGTPFRDPELRAFYDTAGNLRRSGGHIDLERAGGFARYAQFFALYQSPQLVPEGSSDMRSPAWAMFTVPVDAYTKARPNRKIMEDARETKV